MNVILSGNILYRNNPPPPPQIIQVILGLTEVNPELISHLGDEVSIII